MRKKGKFHGSLLSAVMILVILFTALGEKGISAKAETSEKEEVKEQIEEKRNRIRNAYFPEADVADRSAKEDVDVQSAQTMLSTCPLRMVRGVFNSWEAAAKKSRRCWESRVSLAISSCRT